jgi:N-glycosylase/DNA lyase
MFSQEHFNTILKLNEEFISATPARRKEIEQEIVKIASKEQFPPTPELEEISNLQSQLKSSLENLAACGEQVDFDLYTRELNSINEKITEYANRLGADLQRTDYSKVVGDLLKIKFGGK